MLRHQLRRSTSGRRAVTHRTRNSSAAPIATAPIGVSHRPSPANGMNSWPQVRSRSRSDGRMKTSAPVTRAMRSRKAPTRSGRLRFGPQRRRFGVDFLSVGDQTATCAMRDGEHQPDGEVDQEDRPPVGDREDQGAEQRPDDAARLLDRRHDPEGYGAALDGVEIGDEGQRGRHQAAAAQALQEPAGHHRRHVVGERGDQRAEGEDHQRGDQHRHPAAQVGDPADQRQHRDVAEQEAGDDRRGALELLGGVAHRAEHVGQRQDDDVGVRGGERDRDGGQGQQPPRRDLAHGSEMSFSVP